MENVHRFSLVTKAVFTGTEQTQILISVVRDPLPLPVAAAAPYSKSSSKQFPGGRGSSRQWVECLGRQQREGETAKIRGSLLPTDVPSVSARTVEDVPHPNCTG